MEYILIAISVVVVIVLICYTIANKYGLRNIGLGSGKQKKSEELTNESSSSGSETLKPSTDYTGMKPRELCKAVLRDLSCYVVEKDKSEESDEDDDDNESGEDGEDDDRIEFSFQGETFCLIVSDDCLLVTVYDFSWGSISLDDIDELSLLRKAINSVNTRFGGLCVVYTIDTERNRMVVHTKRQFIMVPQIPQILEYMTAMLTGFFEVQRALRHELDSERMKKNDA